LCNHGVILNYFLNYFLNKNILYMKKEKVYKVKTGITINNDLIELMDEYLTEINNLNRSKYVEKLIKEDLEKRGKKIDENF
jgi:hypothetical protein